MRWIDWFSDGADQANPLLKDIQWASHDWMAVGYHQEQLVVQFCLFKREILAWRLSADGCWCRRGGLPTRIAQERSWQGNCCWQPSHLCAKNLACAICIADLC